MKFPKEEYTRINGPHGIDGFSDVPPTVAGWYWFLFPKQHQLGRRDTIWEVQRCGGGQEGPEHLAVVIGNGCWGMDQIISQGGLFGPRIPAAQELAAIKGE